MSTQGYCVDARAQAGRLCYVRGDVEEGGWPSTQGCCVDAHAQAGRLCYVLGDVEEGG
jgi:hypothetical protein